MFDRFKGKTEESKNKRRPRGVSPTYVTNDSVILCKASPMVRNAYEIRLALYMASTRKSQFILVVRPGAQVEPALRAHLEKHGGSVQEKEFADHSVYVGHIKRSGEEGDGWVLGDAAALSRFQSSLRSDWCRKKLVVGSSLANGDLDTLERELGAETTSQTNIDDENIRTALLTLARAAKTEGGTIFVQ